jgi:hypothetical protein
LSKKAEQKLVGAALFMHEVKKAGGIEPFKEQLRNEGRAEMIEKFADHYSRSIGYEEQLEMKF